VPPPDSLEPATAQSAPDVPIATPAVEAERIPAHHRENPEKLTGDALRELAYRRGIARSEAATMSDEKLRLSLRYAASAWAEEN
jgi:hypothetical protein